MKIRITKKPVKKYQGGGEPLLEDFPDFGSLKSAHDAWLAAGGSSLMLPQGNVSTSQTAAPATIFNALQYTVSERLRGPQKGMINSTRGVVSQEDTNALENYDWKNFDWKSAPVDPTAQARFNDLQKTFQTGTKKEMRTGIESYNKDYGTNIKKPGLFSMGAKGRENMNELAQDFDNLGYGIKTATAIGNIFTNIADSRRKQQDFDTWMRSQMNSDGLYKPVAGSRGDYVMTGSRFGEFRPNNYVTNRGMFAEYGGENSDSMKIRITKMPSMAYGGQSNYGLDLSRKKVYTDMPEGKSEDVSNSISAVPRQFANIEAEGGETVYGDLDSDGMMEHMKIQGKRHSEGGVPLNVPEGSFIFSDTKKMKIKDPEILKKFGMSFKKGGYTPATIAKKFPINKYKAILEDKNADPLAKKTAKMNYENGEQMLGLLSVVQEGMKDFPQGMPNVAQAAMQVGKAAYGGYMLPKYQGATGSSTVGSKLGEWEDDYQTLSTLLLDPKNAGLRKAMYEEFLKDYPNSPLKKEADGEKKFIDNFLNAQQQFMALNTKFKDKPEYLTSEEWDKYKDSRLYRKEMTDLGYTPMTGREIQRFQGGYRAMMRALKKDPSFIESFGKYFDLNPQGVSDEPEYLGGKNISLDDKIAGNTTIKQFFRLRGEKPVEKQEPGWICDPATGKAVPSATGGYKTKEEAEKNCTPPPPPKKTPPKYLCIDGKIVESTSGMGYDDPTIAAQNCGTPGKEIPFDYLTPDKYKFLAALSFPPKKYFPYEPPIDLPMAQPVFRDPNRQIAANAELANIATQNYAFANPQAYAANFAGIQGNLAGNVANTIADTQNYNVGIANQFEMANTETEAKENILNAQRATSLWDKNVRTNQNFDNAMRAYAMQAANAFEPMWNNRGELYSRNRRSKYFYRDPRTYKEIFKGNPADIFTNPDFAGGSSGLSGGGYESIGSNFNTLYGQIYNQIKDPNLTEAEKKAQAIKLANLAISTSAQRNTSTYDQLGMPRLSTRRSTYYPSITNDDDDYFGYGGMFGW